MRYLPLNYNQISTIQGMRSPNHVKAHNNYSYAYWERALFQRMSSVFKFELPDTWQGEITDFFYWVLFRRGFMVVAYDEQFGTFFQPCSVNGISFYYNPTEAIVANPKLNKRYTIHEDCELIKLTPDYMGTWDIVERFAVQLSTLDTSINTNIINSKTAFLLGAKNKNTAEALKSIIDKVNRGEPAVFYDKPLVGNKPTSDETPFQFLPIQKIKDNYILMELLREQQTILNEFDAEVGIPSIPYEKKERLVTYEAESRKADAMSRIEVWTKSLDTSIGLVNKMFPELNISYELRWDNGNSENDIDRNDELSFR